MAHVLSTSHVYIWVLLTYIRTTLFHWPIFTFNTPNAYFPRQWPSKFHFNNTSLTPSRPVCYSGEGGSNIHKQTTFCSAAIRDLKHNCSLVNKLPPNPPHTRQAYSISIIFRNSVRKAIICPRHHSTTALQHHSFAAWFLWPAWCYSVGCVHVTHTLHVSYSSIHYLTISTNKMRVVSFEHSQRILQSETTAELVRHSCWRRWCPSNKLTHTYIPTC